MVPIMAAMSQCGVNCASRAVAPVAATVRQRASGGRHRLLASLLTAAVAAGMAQAVAAHGSLNATQGTWFDYSVSASLYPNIACVGTTLASVYDPQTCTGVTVYVNGGSIDMGFQASCSDDGSSLTYLVRFDTSSCSGTSGDCITATVASGTCVVASMNNQPVSAMMTCGTGTPTSLFLGVVVGGSALLLLCIVCWCCRDRFRARCIRRPGYMEDAPAGGYLQLGGGGGTARSSAAVVRSAAVPAAAPATSKFCTSCGARMDGAFCPSCGAARRAKVPWDDADGLSVGGDGGL